MFIIGYLQDIVYMHKFLSIWLNNICYILLVNRAELLEASRVHVHPSRKKLTLQLAWKSVCASL
jgi:hypothetical protein